MQLALLYYYIQIILGKEKATMKKKGNRDFHKDYADIYREKGDVYDETRVGGECIGEGSYEKNSPSIYHMNDR